jgi:hypothetical protein
MRIGRGNRSTRSKACRSTNLTTTWDRSQVPIVGVRRLTASAVVHSPPQNLLALSKHVVSCADPVRTGNGIRGCDAGGGSKEKSKVYFRIQLRICNLAVAGSSRPLLVVMCTKCFLLGLRWFEERPATAEGRFLCA